MSDAQLARKRERNAILSALEIFRTIDVPRNFYSMVVFLYVCENEGLNVSELAFVTRMRVATVARIVKVLAGDVAEEQVEPQNVLFEFRASDQDRRLKFVYLTERGRRLRDDLEGLIASANPIVV